MAATIPNNSTVEKTLPLRCFCSQSVQSKCPCNMAAYCSTNCQSSDWKTHRTVCLFWKQQQLSAQLIGPKNKEDEPSSAKKRTHDDSGGEDNDGSPKKLRPSPKNIDTIVTTYSIQDIQDYLTANPGSETVQLIMEQRDKIVEANEYIGTPFRIFCRGMREIMRLVYWQLRMNPRDSIQTLRLPAYLVNRVHYWYDLPQAGPVTIQTLQSSHQWKSDADIPLLPINPLGRSYFEILQWASRDYVYNSSSVQHPEELTVNSIYVSSFLRSCIELFTLKMNIIDQKEEAANNPPPLPPPPPPPAQPSPEEQQQYQDMMDYEENEEEFARYEDSHYTEKRNNLIATYDRTFNVWLQHMLHLQTFVDSSVTPPKPLLVTAVDMVIINYLVKLVEALKKSMLVDFDRKTLSRLRNGCSKLLESDHPAGSSGLQFSAITDWILYVYTHADTVDLNRRIFFYKNDVAYVNTTDMFAESVRNESFFNQAIVKKRHKILSNTRYKEPLIFSHLPGGHKTFDNMFVESNVALNRMLNIPMLVQGYYTSFNIDHLQDPHMHLAMRHDLHLRHFNEKLLHNNLSWALLYAMYGDLVHAHDIADTVQIFFDPSVPSTMQYSGNRMVALTTALLSNNYDWWHKIITHTRSSPSSPAELVQCLVFAIHRGMRSFIDRWHAQEHDLFVDTLGALHFILHHDRQQYVPGQQAEVALIAYMYHYAVVFQQVNILLWLEETYPENPNRRALWGSLMAVHLLTAKATRTQANLKIIIRALDKDQIKLPETVTSDLVTTLQRLKAQYSWLHLSYSREFLNIRSLLIDREQDIVETAIFEMLLKQLAPGNFYKSLLSLNLLTWFIFLDQLYINDEYGRRSTYDESDPDETNAINLAESNTLLLSNITLHGMRIWQAIVDRLIELRVLEAAPDEHRRVWSRLPGEDPDGGGAGAVDEDKVDDELFQLADRLLHPPSQVRPKKASPPPAVNKSRNLTERPSVVVDSATAQTKHLTHPNYVFSAPRSVRLKKYYHEMDEMYAPQSRARRQRNFRKDFPEMDSDEDEEDGPRQARRESNTATLNVTIPTFMDILPFDATGINLLEMLIKGDYTKDCLGVLGRLTDIMDVFHVFIVAKKTARQTWTKLTGLSEEAKTYALATSYGQQNVLNYGVYKQQQQQDYSYAGYGQKWEDSMLPMLNATAMETLVVDYSSSSRFTADIEILYPLITLACFQRQHLVHANTGRHTFAFIYFLPNTFDLTDISAADRESKYLLIQELKHQKEGLWSVDTPLQQLLQNMPQWSAASENVSSQQPTIVAYYRRLEKILQVFEATRLSLVTIVDRTASAPTKSPILLATPLSEQGHIQSQVPIVGLFYNIGRPFMAHHIPMDFALDLSQQTNTELKNKRNRQLQIGKSSPAYINYHTKVPLSVRVIQQDLDHYPVTPRCHTPQVPSRNIFNQLVARWRARIHQWSHENNQLDFSQSTGSASSAFSLDRTTIQVLVGENGDDDSSSNSSSSGDSAPTEDGTYARFSKTLETLHIPHKNTKCEAELCKWELYYYDLQQEEFQKNRTFNPGQCLNLQINQHELQSPMLGMTMLSSDDIIQERNHEKSLTVMVDSLTSSTDLPSSKKTY